MDTSFNIHTKSENAFKGYAVNLAGLSTEIKFTCAMTQLDRRIKGTHVN